jgi:hypothetical protein
MLDRQIEGFALALGQLLRGVVGAGLLGDAGVVAASEAQGYYFYRPLSAARIADLLREPNNEIAADYAIAPS